MQTLLDENTDQATEDVVTHYGFEAAGFRYLVPQGEHSELVARSNIGAIPDTPGCFLGFINHRGEPRPVFSLERLVDADADASGRWVLLIGRGSRKVGVLLCRPPLSLTGMEEKTNMTESQPFSGDAYVRQGECWREFSYSQFCDGVSAAFKRSEWAPS